MEDKIRDGLSAIRAANEAITDLGFILTTLIEDLEFAMRGFEMDRKWREVLP